MPPARFDDGVGHAADALVGIDEVARVRAHIELREVQPEDLDAAPQRGKRAVGDASAAVRAQAPVDDGEILGEVVGGSRTRRRRAGAT